MKHSFKLFSLLALVLTAAVLLRLNSVSFSWEEEGRGVFHLEGIEDRGDLFRIRYHDNGFLLEALCDGIMLNPPVVRGTESYLSPLPRGVNHPVFFDKPGGEPSFFKDEEEPSGGVVSVGKPVPIDNGDVVAVDGRHFGFSVYPRSDDYREIIHRPLRDIFKHAGEPRYIGGWLADNAERERMLTDPDRRSLMRELLVEIDAKQLRPLIPRISGYDGKLFRIRRSVGNRTGVLELTPFHVTVLLQRNQHEREARPDTPVPLRNGDIVKIPYNDGSHYLYLKFAITMVRSLPDLSISYKAPTPAYPTFALPPRSAVLRSLQTGTAYRIHKQKDNIFIGDNRLYTMNMDPRQLGYKLHIPDTIPEGGSADLKALLDQEMYYQKGGEYFPVTLSFLEDLRERLTAGEGDENRRCLGFHDYLEEKRIRWKKFERFRLELNRGAGGGERYAGYRHFLEHSVVLARKMKSKGVYRIFNRELDKLNTNHRLYGLGLTVPASMIRQVAYQPPGRSWLKARPLHRDTPIIRGMSNFYWGAMIPDTDAPILFRIRFNRKPGRFLIVAAGNYRYWVEGGEDTAHNFFDGPRNVILPDDARELFVEVWKLKTFNKTIASTNFQARVEILKRAPEAKQPNSAPKEGETDDNRLLTFTSDGEWDASLDGIDWSPVAVDPPGSFVDAAEKEAKLPSLWYREKWAAMSSGVRFRYFRRRFTLPALPSTATVNWKITAIGEHILRVNNQPVEQTSDFLRALKKGTNTLMVVVSRPGYRKRSQGNRMFTVQNDRIQLKKAPIHKSNFKTAKSERKPVITDTDQRVLAYSSDINGKSKRFYTPGVRPELSSIIGNPDKGVYGLEEVFADVYRKDRIAALQLTIRKPWQSIALQAMKEQLLENREKEGEGKEFQKLQSQLKTLTAQLRVKRTDLSQIPAGNQRPTMREIFRLENSIRETRAQIDTVKNPFYEASVVLMSAKGEILAAASYPYDDASMAELNPGIAPPYLPSENPYHNRTWKWKFNPGSTAKIMDAVAFFHSSEEKDNRGNYLYPHLRTLLTEGSTNWKCPGEDLKGSLLLNGKYIGFQLRNFEGHVMPAGFCSLSTALAHSYNTYFSYLALHNNRVLMNDSMVYREGEVKKGHVKFVLKTALPIDRIYRDYPLLETAERMMMNRRIDLLYNVGRTPVWPLLNRQPNDAFITVASRFPVNAYTAADIAHYSIGQGDFQLTALQNAIIINTVVNRGELYHPSIIKSITLKEPGDWGKIGEPIPLNPVLDRTRIYSVPIAQQVKEAMNEVAERGTAAGLFRKLREGRSFYAKTGTAETEVYLDNSLFVGFVTFKDGTPLIFSVIVPRSGLGARVAGRLTETIITRIIEYENKKGGNL